MMHSLLIGVLLMLISFAVVWAIGVRIRNYSFLDVMWSYSVAILAALYAWQGPGNVERKAAFTVLGMAWSLRLGTYILRRVVRHHPKEDVRYEELRERWKGDGLFLAFHELQASIAVVFSLPFWFASWNSAPLQWVEWLGLAVVLCALSGETAADLQMQRFKAAESNSGRVCNIGFWRYSRHPNYFFEFLVWVGFAIASLATSFGWIALLCPVLIYHFLTRVTGIPLTEKYSLRSKGDAYREYQRTTNAFIPGPRKV